MTIKEFNRTNVRTLNEEVAAALEPIAKKHGLVLDRKGKTFYRDRMPAMFQFIVRVEDADGNVLGAKAQEFKDGARLVGLDPSDLGKEFVSRGSRYRITGLNLRARKYPVLAENLSNGKTYKFAESVVKRGLEAAK
jgi:hypothetical protein